MLTAEPGKALEHRCSLMAGAAAPHPGLQRASGAISLKNDASGLSFSDERFAGIGNSQLSLPCPLGSLAQPCAQERAQGRAHTERTAAARAASLAQQKALDAGNAGLGAEPRAGKAARHRAAHGGSGGSLLSGRLCLAAGSGLLEQP